MRQAKKKLHQTKHPDDPTQHRAHVCIVCDCFIKAAEPLKTMDRKQLKAHRHRLGIREYEIYHQVTLNNPLISQYHVPTLPNMLLSQRSRKIGRGWVTCAHCRSSLRSDNRSSTKPPKFAIANGFAIGEFPQEIMRVNPVSRCETKRKINIEDVSDELRALVHCSNTTLVYSPFSVPDG